MDGQNTIGIGGTGGVSETGMIGSIAEVGSLVNDIVTSAKNMELQEKNYEQQKKMFKYSKNLQQQIFEREDNAVLRRVLDLKRAGLSPVLAAGSAANAGSVISTTAPQHGLYEKMGKYNIAQTAMALMQQQQQIDRTSAENEYIRMQTQKTQADKNLSEVTSAIKKHDLFNLRKSGLSTDKSEFGRWWNDFVGASTGSILTSEGKNLIDKLIDNSKANKRPEVKIQKGASVVKPEGSW